MAEQRVYKRFDLHKEIGVKVPYSGTNITRAYLDDISLGGFQMNTPHAFSVGDEVEFDMQINPERAPLRGKGSVRYLRPVEKNSTHSYAAGVKFEGVDEHQVEQLLDSYFFAQHKKRFYRRYRQEIAFALMISPVILLASWAVSRIGDSIDHFASRQKQETAYVDKLKDAALYFLYHGH